MGNANCPVCQEVLYNLSPIPSQVHYVLDDAEDISPREGTSLVVSRQNSQKSLRQRLFDAANGFRLEENRVLRMFEDRAKFQRQYVPSETSGTTAARTISFKGS